MMLNCIAKIANSVHSICEHNMLFCNLVFSILVVNVIFMAFICFAQIFRVAFTIFSLVLIILACLIIHAGIKENNKALAVQN